MFPMTALETTRILPPPDSAGVLKDSTAIQCCWESDQELVVLEVNEDHCVVLNVSRVWGYEPGTLLFHATGGHTPPPRHGSGALAEPLS